MEESRPYIVSDSSSAAGFILGQAGPKELRRLKGQTPHRMKVNVSARFPAPFSVSTQRGQKV